FQFSFDAKIVSGSFKGYLYLTDSSNNEYCKFETHMYTPRFKLIDLATSYYASFNTWYTIVVTCNNGAMTSTIYAQSDTERTNPLSTASATITNATYNGLKFRWQVAQNTGSGSASYADEYYLDNFIYSYYTYQ
ncbi:MAG: hypothetical protein N2171_02765, partial [Clostridia bacterium]|nr:hypothetical protein [Clostridia bacterium]